MDQAGCVGVMVCILSACCERGLGVRATVQNGTIAQRVHFIPQSLQAIEDWWFACDQEVGLHFWPALFTHARSATEPNGRSPRLLFFSQTDAQRPALILEPDGEREAVTWRKLFC
jgi:hypothetical protein